MASLKEYLGKADRIDKKFNLCRTGRIAAVNMEDEGEIDAMAHCNPHQASTGSATGGGRRGQIHGQGAPPSRGNPKPPNVCYNHSRWGGKTRKCTDPTNCTYKDFISKE